MNCRNSLTSTRRSARNATVAADGASRRIRTPRRRYVYSQIPQPCPGPSRDAGLLLKTCPAPNGGARRLRHHLQVYLQRPVKVVSCATGQASGPATPIARAAARTVAAVVGAI